MPVIIHPCPIILPLAKLAPLKAIKYLVVHCSASSPKNPAISILDIDRMHKQRGFSCVGYHFFIKRDGTIEKGRPDTVAGAHVEGFNMVSLGICMAGGIDEKGKAENNFTPPQFASLAALIKQLEVTYPTAKTLGHRDLSPDKNKDGVISPSEWMKDCPCFDVKVWRKAQK